MNGGTSSPEQFARLRRAMLVGGLALLGAALVVALGIQQKERNFQHWIPYPLWMFSMPGELLVLPFVRSPFTPPSALIAGNALFWFVMGAALGYRVQQAKRALLLLGGLMFMTWFSLYHLMKFLVTTAMPDG